MTIDSDREELHGYFKQEILPLIKQKEHTQEFKKSIDTLISNKFGIKYKIIVRFYDDTVRVSAHKKSNGIIYFMAATSENKADYDFSNEGWATTFFK